MTLLLRWFGLAALWICFALQADTILMPVHPNEPGTVRLQFASANDFSYVQLVHDTVMGGRSHGTLQAVETTALRFSGHLSLANNGGFASAQFNLKQPLPALNFQQIRLQLAADGRRYQLRLKTPFIPNGVAYVAHFDSQPGKASYEFTARDFNGQFRGRAVANMPVLHFADVYQISIMLADKTTGNFDILLYDIEFSALQSI